MDRYDALQDALRALGRLAHRHQGRDADPLQAGDDRQRRLPLRPADLRRLLADLAQHPLLPDRGAALALRRADPRLHRAPARPRLQPRRRRRWSAASCWWGWCDDARCSCRALGPTLGSLALLLGALAFQYLGGLAPCHLCLLQRWPHAAAIALGAAAPRLAAARARARSPALVVLVGAGIARLPRRGRAGLVAGPRHLHRAGAGRAVVGRAARPDPRDAGRALRPGRLEPLGHLDGGLERDPVAGAGSALAAGWRAYASSSASQ